MRVLTDENVRSAPRFGARRRWTRRETGRGRARSGVTDAEVLTAARDANRVVVTYDRKDFADVTEHAGVLIADETMGPREVRRTAERIERAYPDLGNAVEFLSDWL